MRAMWAVFAITIFLLSAGFSALAVQDAQPGTIQGTVLREGTNTPIADVQINVFIKGSLAATGFNAQQVLQAVNRGAAVSPELVQMAQNATRGGAAAAIANAAPLTAVSDNAGRFTVRNVPSGEHFVRAQLQGHFGPAANGLRPPAASANAVVTSQQTTEVRLSLIPGGAISGRVLDPSGKPLFNSPVQALLSTYTDGRQTFQPADVKQTDDRGEFRISLLPPGEYYLAASPVPGVPTGNVPIATMYPGFSDPTKAIPIVVRGGYDSAGMNIQLLTVPAAKVSGRVVSTLPPGPAPGARGGTRPSIASIALVRRDAASPDVFGIPPVTANADDGTFVIQNVPPGSYDVFARLPIAYGWGGLAPPERATTPSAIGRATVDVRGATVDGVTIVVRPGLDVKGRVIVDGKPAAAPLRLALQPDENALRVPDNVDAQIFGQIAQYRTRIEQDGSFAIPVVPDGRYRFQVALAGATPDVAPSANSYIEDIRQGGVSVYDNGLSVVGDNVNLVEVLVNNNGGSIAGTLVGSDRRPVPNTMVVLVPAENRRQNPALYKTAGTNTQGQFLLTNLGPGTYKLFAWESVPPGAYQNAEFLRKYEGRGVSVAVASGARVSTDVVLIRD